MLFAIAPSAISVRESDPSRKTWQTVLNGDVFELRSDDSESKPNVTNASAGTQAGAKTADLLEVKPFVKPVGNTLDTATSLPAAPNGFYFHKLNPENTEVTCDAFGKSTWLPPE